MKEIPKTIEQAINSIYIGLSPSEIEELKRVDPKSLHHSMGRYYRNNWNLWHDSPLKTNFIERFGLFGHGDDISGVILAGLGETLTAGNAYADSVKKVIDIEIERYKRHWERNGIDPKTGKEMNKTLPTAVCIVIKNKEGKYLCGSRRGTNDQWGLIGGKVDPMEGFVDAIIRETYEETGLKINIKDVEFIYRGPCGPGLDGRTFDCLAYRYIGDVEKLSPKSMEDGILVEWRSLDDLSKGPFSHYNKNLFDL